MGMGKELTCEQELFWEKTEAEKGTVVEEEQVLQ
jgi:hypothetical protein